MFEHRTLDFEDFDGTYLHPIKDYQVKELCRIVSVEGYVYAVFSNEDMAEECQVFFPNHLGFASVNGYMNALRIA